MCVKPRKSKVSGFPCPQFDAIRRSMTAEPNQSRLFGVHLQPKALEASLEGGPEAGRVGLVLEPQHEVVRVAHDDHLAASDALPPLLYPEVEDVVKVDVREERRNGRPLRCPFICRSTTSLLRGLLRPAISGSAARFLLSAIRCSINFSSHPWSMASKKPRMSASSTQFTFFRMIAIASASSA